MQSPPEKQIWLPSTETRVTVTQDGTVTVWDEMTMTRQPVGKKPTGFREEAERAVEDRE